MSPQQPSLIDAQSLPPFCPQRIISGGQTGVDRAALDAAMALDIPHGGWCPARRRAEDGRIDDRYELTETSSWKYPVRTRRNLEAADATLILARGPLSGGTALTERLAKQVGRTCLAIDLTEADAAGRIERWLRIAVPSTLNVAGPRESTQPGIYEETKRLLTAILQPAEATSASTVWPAARPCQSD